MTESTVSVPERPLTILTALSRRERRDVVRQRVRRARAALHAEIQAIQPYRGGLPAELASAKQRKQVAVKASRREVRQAVLCRTGRRIDLAALLSLTRPDGHPVWAVRDPASTESREGKHDVDNTFYIGNGWRTIKGTKARTTAVIPVGGIPPLPEEARALLRDKKLRRRALWMGLLYQPAEWREVHPDPAIVVEWKDLPGQYFALCVWGADRGRIMEFVD